MELSSKDVDVDHGLLQSSSASIAYTLLIADDFCFSFLVLWCSIDHLLYQTYSTLSTSIAFAAVSIRPGSSQSLLASS